MTGGDMAPIRELRGEVGFSLPELLVTIVIVGITFVAILSGLRTTIAVSASHRTQATTDSVARSAAEWVKDNTQTPYRTTCGGPAMYQDKLHNMPGPPQYTATIQTIQYWDGASAPATGTYTLSPTSPSHILQACSGSDKGLQWITIKASSPDGQTSETVQVIKRQIP